MMSHTQILSVLLCLFCLPSTLGCQAVQGDFFSHKSQASFPLAEELGPKETRAVIENQFPEGPLKDLKDLEVIKACFGASASLKDEEFLVSTGKFYFDSDSIKEPIRLVLDVTVRYKATDLHEPKGITPFLSASVTWKVRWTIHGDLKGFDSEGTKQEIQKRMETGLNNYFFLKLKDLGVRPQTYREKGSPRRS
jgi:hypothetical protein